LRDGLTLRPTAVRTLDNEVNAWRHGSTPCAIRLSARASAGVRPARIRSNSRFQYRWQSTLAKQRAPDVVTPLARQRLIFSDVFRAVRDERDDLLPEPHGVGDALRGGLVLGVHGDEQMHSVCERKAEHRERAFEVVDRFLADILQALQPGALGRA
jgi:hypothetical protein